AHPWPRSPSLKRHVLQVLHAPPSTAPSIPGASVLGPVPLSCGASGNLRNRGTSPPCSTGRRGCCPGLRPLFLSTDAGRPGVAVPPAPWAGPKAPPKVPAQLGQEKLYIKGNEGILHEIQISPAAYRRDVPCSCPCQIQIRSLRNFCKTYPRRPCRWHAHSKRLYGPRRSRHLGNSYGWSSYIVAWTNRCARWPAPLQPSMSP